MVKTYRKPMLTPNQMERAREDQVQNQAGGYVFALDKWDALDRFLILGTEGNTYYATEKDQTLRNYSNVLKCIEDDGERVVKKVIEISTAGRAPKNTPAIFVLALCIAKGTLDTRRAAARAVVVVCRIPTHLFQFLTYVSEHRGHGRVVRNAVRNWYTLSADSGQLPYHVIKYKSREGWSHRDALREFRPKPVNDKTSILYKYMVTGGDNDNLPEQIRAAERLKVTTSVSSAARLIRDYELPWECVPTELLREPEVWGTLLEESLPFTAMVRNLGRMGSIGLFNDPEYTTMVVTRLGNQAQIKSARVHPIQLLSALTVYGSGHGARGSLTWIPNQRIVDALDEAFYLSFGNIEPTDKNIMLALDVSGSMSMGVIAGVPGLTPAIAAAAMAMVTAASEKNYSIMGFSNTFKDLGISPGQRLDTVMQKTRDNNFGSTDCSLPMVHAQLKGLKYDAFVIYTDNETWAGRVHPYQALQEYRKNTGINAKLIVVGLTATDFTIADPRDAGMMDVVGFDTAAPQLISDFIRRE